MMTTLMIAAASGVSRMMPWSSTSSTSIGTANMAAPIWTTVATASGSAVGAVRRMVAA